MSRLHQKILTEDEGPQYFGDGPKAGLTGEGNNITTDPCVYGAIEDALALIARKITPRFAHRLKVRLNRL